MTKLGEFERLLALISTPELQRGLFLARCENLAYARRLRERAIVDAEGAVIATVDFSAEPDDTNILERLTEAATHADVLFAVGLDHLLIDDGEPRSTRAIATLNFNRDLLRERVARPIVIWLSYRAAWAFAHQARDTFDIIQTTFEFPELDPQARDDGLPRWASPAEKKDIPHLEDRARILEQLFTEAPQHSARAAELAASLARIEFSLGCHGEALEWSQRAAEAYEVFGSMEDAALHRRRMSEMLDYLGERERAATELELATKLADPLVKHSNVATEQPLDIRRAGDRQAYRVDDIKIAVGESLARTSEKPRHTFARLRIDPNHPDPRKLIPAIDALRRGEVIIYPTDTGYAFGCALSSAKGIAAIRRLKGIHKKHEKPLTMMVENLQDLGRYGLMSNSAFRVVRRLLPGPYTIVLRASSDVPRVMRNRAHEVGMRLPDHQLCAMLVEFLGEPLLTGSVSSGEAEPQLEEPEDLELRYAREVGLIIDAGYLWPEPSTVLRFDASGDIEVLRVGQGPVPDW